MTYPTFKQEADRLCAHRPPQTPEASEALDNVRDAFDELTARLDSYLPEPNPDATFAARSVHRACQDVISAIVHNQ